MYPDPGSISPGPTSATSVAQEATSPKQSPAEVFQSLTRRLRVRWPIDRAVLVIGNHDQTEYFATACFEDGCQKQLALRLPGQSSLLKQVADGGCVYTESFCGLFSGNDIEKKLLLRNDAEAIAVVPVKTEGRVVGLIGLSSHDPLAFALFDEDSLGNEGLSLGNSIIAGTATK